MNEPLSMTPLQASRVAPGASNESGHAHALPPGARIGAYEVQRVLVQTACTTVYRAADHALALPVAIQEFLPKRLVRRDTALHLHIAHGADAARVGRGLQAFIDEARWLARADHPALVRVSQLIESNGTAYRVMPLYDGRRLRDARRGLRTAPDEATLRAWLLGLLGAVDALHQSGTRVHGAVSPADILSLRDGRLVLLGPNDADREISSDLVEALMAGLQAPFAPTRPVAAATSEPAAGPWVDVRAIAEVGRFGITGEWSDGSRERVSLAVTVARAQQAGRCPPYGAAFIAALEAASASPALGRLPTVAHLRDALERSAAPAPRVRATSAATAATLADGAAGFEARDANGNRADLRPMPPDSAAAHRDGPAFEGALTFGSADDVEPSLGLPEHTHGPGGPRAPWGKTALAPTLARHAAVARRRRVALVLSGLGIVGSVVAVLVGGGRHWLPEPGFAPPAWEGPASAAPDPAAPPRAEPDAAVNTPAAARPAEPAPGEQATAQDAAALRAQATVASAVEAATAATSATAAAPSAPPATETAPAPAPRESDTTVAQKTAAIPPPTSKAAWPALAKTAAKAPPKSPSKSLSKSPSKLPSKASSKAPPTPAAKPMPAKAPAEAARTPAPATASAKPAAAGAETPRSACGPRSDFALYRCMQSQCRGARWSSHAQCVKLRLTDDVG